jgi:orotate phosphoribosyltransferase
MSKSQENWIRTYWEKSAFWTHDGNAKRPHALLTSGKHSNGFFNSELVIEHPRLFMEAAQDLVNMLMADGLDIESIDRVVGPAMGAITLASNVAFCIDDLRQKTCLTAYAEKDGCGNMIFRKTYIKTGERLLIVEDVLTTGQTINAVVRHAKALGAIITPFVGVLVNRSGFATVDDRSIVALIDPHMPIWEANQCPLCAQGSEVIRPKGVINWERLNATY